MLLTLGTHMNALILENSLFFPCLTGNLVGDGFARDCVHHQYFSAKPGLSLLFIPSGLPTAVRLSGPDIILSQRILKSPTGAVITMLIPPDRTGEGRRMLAASTSL